MLTFLNESMIENNKSIQSFLEALMKKSKN
jgi:hypothetical protein